MVDPTFISKVLLASSNQNKIREFQEIAKGFSIEVVSPSELADTPPQVEETGDTFFENALLKARAYAEWANIPALADDSGLEVDALEGRPGVLSARYAGESASDEDRNNLLLKELRELQKKSSEKLNKAARFVCSLVLYYPSSAYLTAEGVMEGYILDEPRGEGGFGYDPIVYINSLSKTLAEVEFETTCNESFRAQAAKEIFNKLDSLR